MATKSAQGTVFREVPILGTGSRPVTQGLIGRKVEQGIELMIDCSPSMEGEGKLVQANAALAACLSALRAPENRDAFHAGVVKFSDTAEEHLAPQLVTQIAMEKLAVAIGGPGTDIAAALDRAREIIKRAYADTVWARPMGVLLTDGAQTEPGDPRAAATAFKKHADLVCVGFGTSAKMDVLRELATSPEHAVRILDGSELRRFFVAVAASMSLANRTGQQAIALLGKGRSVVRG